MQPASGGEQSLEPAAVGRSARKRDAIREAATDVFLRSGYRGASMDEIAARAGVSKQTVYKHFADKQSLFSEIVRRAVDEAGDPVHDEVLDLERSADIEADLNGLAKRLLRRVMQPRILQLRRLVIGEAERFPELGNTFYEQGPGRTMETLASVLEQLGARGVLELEDPQLAAAHLNWLVVSIPLNRAMLLAEDEPSPAELDRYAEAGVRAFLRAHRRPAARRGG